MTNLTYPLCISLALGIAGCSSDEGILLGVSGDDLAEIEFVVGVERGDRFLVDSETSGMIVDVQGRNLRLRPYELLLRPPEGADKAGRLLVLVRGWHVGRNGNKRVVSLGVLDPAQPFIDGELLRRNVGLRGLSGRVRTGSENGCYTARIGDQNWRWIDPGNLDCDPVRADAQAPDCDDQDERVYPGAPERCDGRDNTCDGRLGPERGVCFALANRDDGPCREGTRFCELDGRGAGECTPVDTPAPEALCVPSSGCDERADPRACLLNARRTTQRCVHRLNSESQACGGPKVRLHPPHGAESCRWEIFEARGLTASFAGQQTTTECEPRLNLSVSPLPLSGSVTLDFFADGKAGWLVELVMVSESVESCEEVEAVSCE